MDLIHPAGEGAHHGGDRDLNRLPLIDAVLIGIAEVEGEFELFVVDQGGYRGARGDLLLGLKGLHLSELAREGGAEGEVGGLLLEVGHILLQGVHPLLGVGYLVLSRLAEDAVQGLAGGDSLAGIDKDFLDRAALGQGDSRRLLGLGRTAARYPALQGANLSGLGQNFSRLIVGRE